MVRPHQKPRETATEWLEIWIRTKAARFRASSSTAKLLTIGQREARNYDAPPWVGNLSRGGKDLSDSRQASL